MDNEYIPVSEAAKRMNISRMLLGRRIRSGDLPCFEDPLDFRRKLVRTRDLETLRRPRPAQPRNETAASAS